MDLPFGTLFKDFYKTYSRWNIRTSEFQLLEIDQKSIRSGCKPVDFLWQAIDLVFPPFCCHCGRIGYELCPDCFSKIELLDQSSFCEVCGGKKHEDGICKAKGIFMDKIHSWGYYQGPLKSTVQKLKYKRGMGLVSYLVPFLETFIANWFDQFDVITPLPLGRKREHERGYNQTALFTKPLARNLGFPYLPEAVVRVRETRSQVGLSAVERRSNISDAFHADEKKVKGLKVLLMDDITTTSATINECAKALKLGGAESVYCFTLAKAANQI